MGSQFSPYASWMAKHLPPVNPSATLLDVGGVTGDALSTLRPELTFSPVSLLSEHWSTAPDTADAVLAFDYAITPEFLQITQRVLRPGGRLIIINPYGDASADHVATLEAAAYQRIMVEAIDGLDGVLLRGERAHVTADTFARVQSVAQHEADTLDLSTYRGRWLYLLVQQTPNLPAWKLSPETPITWSAVAIHGDDQPVLLAFSSLPKAVAFMQPAVMAGVIRDVNKVPKFDRERAHDWPRVLLNPTLDTIRTEQITGYEIDPNTAEAPDE